MTDTWLATAGLRGGQILEASFSTFAASHTPLLSASAVSQGFCTSRWTGQLRRKSLLCRAWRPGEVSFYLLQLSLKSFFLHSRAGVRLRNQRLQTLPASLSPVGAAPVLSDGRDLMRPHPVLVQSRQVGAARRCPFWTVRLCSSPTFPLCLGL